MLQLTCNNCKVILLFFFTGLYVQGRAQVGVGTITPAPSAVLDVSSTNKGFLPPRVTKENRSQIKTPAAGLMIWCSNCTLTGEAQVYNGNDWTNFSGRTRSDLQVGDTFGGGIIVYILGPADTSYTPGEKHSLIAGLSDIGSDIPWGCHGTLIRSFPGKGTSDGLWTGAKNTANIISVCTTAGIAARLCSDLVQNQYDDWHLPSKNEIQLVYNILVFYGLFQGVYWTSTEVSSGTAWSFNFANNSYSQSSSKGDGLRVRPVRYF